MLLEMRILVSRAFQVVLQPEFSPVFLAHVPLFFLDCFGEPPDTAVLMPQNSPYATVPGLAVVCPLSSIQGCLMNVPNRRWKRQG